MRRILVPLMLLLAVQAAAADLVLFNWNILNFPGSTGATRAPQIDLEGRNRTWIPSEVHSQDKIGIQPTQPSEP